MTASDWQPPRCEHGAIILACPSEDCAAQNAYLDQQKAAMREWDHRQIQAARDYVRSELGLPRDTYVCPECTLLAGRVVEEAHNQLGLM